MEEYKRVLKIQKAGRSKMHVIIVSIVRTTISFIVLMLITLFFGKQINSHKNYFNYALSITLGSFVANMGFDVNIKFIPMLVALSTLILGYVLLSYASNKSVWIRQWVAGKPTVIINNGQVLEERMKKSKYTIDNLNQQLRELGIFNIEEVEFAILEVSGNLSVLKKEIYLNTVKKDLSNSYSRDSIFPTEMILEGKMIKENLKPPYDLAWLKEELERKNVKVAEINYAVLSTNGELYIDTFKDSRGSVDATS
ncbi:MAG: DUF421 domain-containing protein [Bacillota bacterium]|nr:DUF421 domain-containing protein [Bacillota bacterium]